MIEFLSVLLLICMAYIVYKIYAAIYFRGKKFAAIKNSILKYTTDCNQLNDHIEELKTSYSHMKSFDYGESQLNDHSNYNMKRKMWEEQTKSDRIYNCSASVCKNAHSQPFKYLCKYFNIKVDEATLSNLEMVLNNFSAAEQGKELLRKERDKIVLSVSSSIPSIIAFFDDERIIDELGFKRIDFRDIYFPVYTFQYVSAGGNSAMKCEIQLNIQNLDNFIIYLSELIKFKKSVAGQRALMTSSLREKIKIRDNYTCKKCRLSVANERNLLLEIDHIIPLSKGGMTTEKNLQTLCWKCNRSKGAKIGW